jgi:hypothetical protein
MEERAASSLDRFIRLINQLRAIPRSRRLLCEAFWFAVVEAVRLL